jgi:hypothetical protein
LKISIKKVAGYEYRYLKIDFNYSEDHVLIDNIKDKAMDLCNKVDPHSPNGLLRDGITRLQKNIGGLLAEEAVKIYITNIIEDKSLDVKIIEKNTKYNEIQDDNQIDMTLKVKNTIKNIEIRSSFFYYIRKNEPEKLFAPYKDKSKSAASIIGWYTHKHKFKEVKKNFYIFVIHHYHPKEIINRCRRKVDLYIAGAASRATIEKEGQNQSLKMSGAYYRVINPLIKVPDPINAINSLLKVVN